jgi:hypothetical protein
MNQQVTWRCKECEAVVTSFSENGTGLPNCPICASPKEASVATAPEGNGPEPYDARAKTRFADTAGPELDRLLARRVLGGEGHPPAPPYSSEDLAATALAELVGRQSDWSFHLAFCGNAWMATFTEKGEQKNNVPNPPVASFVSATGRTRSLAICRALLKVTRCPRWSPLGTNFLRGAQPAIARAAGFELLPGRPGFATT